MWNIPLKYIQCVTEEEKGRGGDKREEEAYRNRGGGRRKKKRGRGRRLGDRGVLMSKTTATFGAGHLTNQDT